MRNRIFAVLALAVLAGGGLAYGTYNAINTQPVKTVAAPTQPVTTSPKLATALEALRTKVAFWDQDREMAPDIEAAKALIATPLFRDLVPLRIVS